MKQHVFIPLTSMYDAGSKVIFNQKYFEIQSNYTDLRNARILKIIFLPMKSVQATDLVHEASAARTELGEQVDHRSRRRDAFVSHEERRRLRTQVVGRLHGTLTRAACRTAARDVR